MNQSITYSVVVPVYNSEQSLEELCKRIIQTVSPYSFEIIFVDDGSNDASWGKITQIKNTNEKIIKAIQLQKNYGQHAALLCGLSYIKGDFCITIDDDLQYNPEDIMKLIQKQQDTNADVIYGTVADKQHSHARNMGSYYVKKSSNLLDNKTGEGSSFRIIARKVVDTIVTNHRHNFIFIDEVLQWYASSFGYVPVAHNARQQGKSGYSFLRLVKLYLNILTNYSALPLKIMTYAGCIFSCVFFVTGVVFVSRKLLYNILIGYTSIIVAILFSASIIMFCLGIIGQYLFKMYLSQQNKPVYTIKQII